MNNQTETTTTQKKRGFAVNQLLAGATPAAAVVAGALIVPKLPPFQGD